MRNPDKLAETGSRASEGWSHYKTPDTRPSRFATYLIDLEHRFVLVKFTGTVTFHDIEEYALRLLADPRFSPSLSEIIDLLEVEKVELNPKQAMSLADRVDPFSLESRRAFVAQSQAQINASHVHRILRSEGSNIHVFFSIAEAKQWIGV
jgi:hypothetical protein